MLFWWCSCHQNLIIWVPILSPECKWFAKILIVKGTPSGREASALCSFTVEHSYNNSHINPAINNAIKIALAPVF